MSYYDVHIGKLINGKRELKGGGVYLVCTPEKEIIEVNSLDEYEGKFVTEREIENLLYNFCKETIIEFAASNDNENVYTFSIYTDAAHGSYIVYINNLDALNKSVEHAYQRHQQRYLEEQNEYYNRSKEQIYNDYKFDEGDYNFMFHDIHKELHNLLNVYYCVSLGEPDYLDIEQNIIFEKKIVDSQLYLIAINVINRLKNDFNVLNRTNDFIAYVSSAHGDGGDYLTLSTLVRKCVNQELLYKAMPDLKEKDDRFNHIIATVKDKSIEEQFYYWLSSIEGGEFGENNIKKYWKTDYEAYELLLELGQQIIPLIKSSLQTELSNSTHYILEQILKDLNM